MRTWALILILFSSNAYSFNIPENAIAYKRMLVREVRAEHGLNGPVALHAALIHQESRWNPLAKSPVGASGLAQFMPATADWMGEIDRRLVGSKTIDPRWSIRAMSVYTKWLNNRFNGYNECQKWAFSLSGYNGGIGWVWKDQKLTEAAGEDKKKWFDNVEKYSERSTSAFNENRHYVNIILNNFQEKYYNNGFKSGGLICQ